MNSLPLLLDLEAAADRPDLAGGKGAGLGRLARYGLPVPEGFVVTTVAYELAMHGEAAFFSGCLLSSEPDPQILAAMRTHIEAKPLPPGLASTLAAALRRRGWETRPLAVRSSAPQEDSRQASFAGIHRSLLNVIGPDALADALRAVWASLWTPQAAAYRRRLGIADAEAAMAVVIMPLVPAEAAGVAFSCDPLGGRDDQVVINAVAGLGEALVGGQLAGETIVLEEDPISDAFSLVRREAGQQNFALAPAPGGGIRREPRPASPIPVLDDARALELARLVRDAAFALDFTAPWFDMEWAWDGRQFHLLQARPVTARPWHAYPALAGRGALWSNGNTRDVVPLPMQAADWEVGRKLVNLLLEKGYRVAGFPLLPGAQRGRLFSGRLYLDAAFIQWEGFAGFGVLPEAMNRLLGGHHPEITVPRLAWRDKWRQFGYLLRYMARTPALRRLGRRQARDAFEQCRHWRREDLAALSDAALAERLNRLLPHTRRQTGLHLLQGSAGGSLHMLLELVDGRLPGEGHGLVAALMAGGEGSISARQGYELMALARLAASEAAVAEWSRRGAPYRLEDLPADSSFRRAFADFIETYGHRGIYESYLRSPRWREDPGYLVESLPDLARMDTEALARRQRDGAAAAWRRLEKVLSPGKRLWARLLLKAARDETNDRELARSAFTAYGEIGRLLLLEAGRRLQAAGLIDQPEDVFHLMPWELAAAEARRLPGPALRRRIGDRAALLAHWERHPAPEVIEEGAAPPAAAVPASGDGTVWQGVPVGAGSAAGIARRIDRPEDGARLAPGEILIAPATDPAWTPLFLKAGGLIMETGGYLSHGAIVAREFGIPAVANLPGIRQALEDGRRVRVDGSRGRVELLA